MRVQLRVLAVDRGAQRKEGRLDVLHQLLVARAQPGFVGLEVIEIGGDEAAAGAGPIALAGEGDRLLHRGARLGQAQRFNAHPQEEGYGPERTGEHREAGAGDPRGACLGERDEQTHAPFEPERGVRSRSHREPAAFGGVADRDLRPIRRRGRSGRDPEGRLGIEPVPPGCGEMDQDQVHPGSRRQVRGSDPDPIVLLAVRVVGLERERELRTEPVGAQRGFQAE